MLDQCQVNVYIVYKVKYQPMNIYICTGENITEYIIKTETVH